MNLNYKKNTNEILFSNFRNKELLNVDDPQNYIPLYENFFSLNEHNFNSINLNNKKRITEITEKVSENKYKIKYEDTETNNIHETELFFKLSPLLDPIKFLAGKYDVNDENMDSSHTYLHNYTIIMDFYMEQTSMDLFLE